MNFNCLIIVLYRKSQKTFILLNLLFLSETTANFSQRTVFSKLQ